MQQQVAESEATRETQPVPVKLRRRLWAVVGAALAFQTTACVEGNRRPEFDAWQQSVSALSLGPDGWIQAVNFVAFGLVVLTTVTVWRRVLEAGRGARAVPFLTLLSGVSLVACGLIPQDPAPGYDPAGLSLTAPTLSGLLHLGAAAVGALSSIASLLVLATRVRTDVLWRGWAEYSIALAVIMVTCIAVYAVWSTAATGYAGLFERIALSLAPLWLLTFLARLEAGRPFMIVQRATTES